MNNNNEIVYYNYNYSTPLAYTTELYIYQQFIIVLELLHFHN